MKVFVIDMARCNGCRNCQVSCKDEHVDNDWRPYAAPQPDTGQFWCKVEEEVCGQVPHVRVSFNQTRCNHCDNAPCIKAAPDAVYRRDDGLVIIDPDKAVGNKALAKACPYGAIWWNEELNLPQKCTGCAHLLDDGWEAPRCVDACCTGALRFGEEEDFADEIAQAEVLRPDLGCGPRVYYLNKPKRFAAGTVVDLEQEEVVIGASVVLETAEDSQVAAAETDDFGDFWLEGAEPGAYRVRVSAPGYFERTIDVNLTAESKSLGRVDVFVQQ